MTKPKPKRRTEYVPLDELVPADRNAKGHDASTIAGSINRFGFIEPIVMDERTGKLVAGHGRREDLLTRRESGQEPPDGVVVRAGVWMVPVNRGWASSDDAEALAAGIALNRATESGGWKRDDLFATLTDLMLTDEGLAGIGFSALDFEALAALAGEPPDLEAMRSQLGTSGDRDFWPQIKLTVSPATKARWDAWLLVDTFDEDDEIVGYLLDHVAKR